jgi:hypothetical protein
MDVCRWKIKKERSFITMKLQKRRKRRNSVGKVCMNMASGLSL